MPKIPQRGEVVVHAGVPQAAPEGAAVRIGGIDFGLRARLRSAGEGRRGGEAGRTGIGAGRQSTLAARAAVPTYVRSPLRKARHSPPQCEPAEAGHAATGPRSAVLAIRREDASGFYRAMTVAPSRTRPAGRSPCAQLAVRGVIRWRDVDEQLGGAGAVQPAEDRAATTGAVPPASDAPGRRRL